MHSQPLSAEVVRQLWERVRQRNRLESELTRRSDRCVQSVETHVKTYRLVLHLECGHTKEVTCSAAKFEKGYRGPTTVRCHDCGVELYAFVKRHAESDCA